MKRIAINGYGRIGRQVLRAIYETGRREEFDIVAINDLGSRAVNEHLTRFDSTHGAFSAAVSLDNDRLVVEDDHIALLSEAEPSDLPWAKLGVDLVVECTGKFKRRDGLSGHLEAGAPRVLAGMPVADADAMVVYGVNEAVLDGTQRIVSNASCTTNCLAPMARVLHDSVGIEQGLMTTIHAYTNDQNLLDGPHSDLYRSRAAAQSMIPTKTGAAEAVGKVLPALAGKLDGMAVRVPTANVSLVDLVFTAGRATSVEAVNQAMRDALTQLPSGVLQYNELPLVSVDFNHNPASCVFDSTQTRVDGRLVKVMAWYDNEWAYANRLLDIAGLMS